MVDFGGDSMPGRLEKVERRLGHVERRLGNVERQVSTLKTDVDEQFEQVARRFEQVDQRFDQIDQRFERTERLILSEAENTRRHFDVVAEQMKAERNLVLDLALANAEKISDHELRLGKLERRVNSE